MLRKYTCLISAGVKMKVAFYNSRETINILIKYRHNSMFMKKHTVILLYGEKIYYTMSEYYLIQISGICVLTKHPLSISKESSQKFWQFKWFTAQTISEQNDKRVDRTEVCFCRKTEQGAMLECKSDACKIGQFHLSCLRLKKIPQKSWSCPDCRQITCKS